MTKSDLPTADAANTFSLVLEQNMHHDAIVDLHDRAFGPGRYVRAAFRLREQGAHDPALSFVALDHDGKLIGTVRLTWIFASESKQRGLLLGPLAVEASARDQGIGKALVAKCVEAAAQSEANFVLLVGDQPYYGPLGFEIVPNRSLQLPGPVDLNRLLVCPLGGFEPVELAGVVSHIDTAPKA